MKFNCERCGKCCKPNWGGDKQYQCILLNNEDIERIADFMNMSKMDLCRTYRINGNQIDTTRIACSFLKNKRCIIHGVKPTCCANWPFNKLNEDSNKVKISAKKCPGIKLD